jgi:hypothetical protein
MERTRSGAYQPLAPFRWPDTRASARFYTRGEQELSEQRIREPRTCRFSREEATSDSGIIERYRTATADGQL